MTITSPPVESSLPHPWTGDDYEDGFPVTLVTELNMRAASNTIREKPDWWLKYKDPIIGSKWRQELLETRITFAPRINTRGRDSDLEKSTDEEEGNQQEPVQFGGGGEGVESEVEEEENSDEEENVEGAEDTTETNEPAGDDDSQDIDNDGDDDDNEEEDEGDDEDDDDDDGEEDKKDTDAEKDTEMTDATTDDNDKGKDPKEPIELFQKDRLSKAQIDYIFKELDYYAEIRNKSILFPTLSNHEANIEQAIEMTWKSDNLISEDLKTRFLKEITKLENSIPEYLKDWHPGSNNQVLDLVHPSLFPVITGVTKVTTEPAIPGLKFVNQGNVLEKNACPKDRETRYWSRDYQWLPTDVEVDEKGQCRFKSYINNLHPEQFQDLYPVLEDILTSFLPMFENVVGEMIPLGPKPTPEEYRDGRVTAESKRLKMSSYDWYIETKTWNDFANDDDDGWDHYYQNRPLKAVKIPEDIKPIVCSPYSLKGKTLQVITKLANIVLTPENPIYKGGSWHVEGMANERIVASGIYYYENMNVTESRLNFRISVYEPEYEQSDDRGVESMYNLGNEEALVQNLTGIVTKQDRCIAFPNIYQHQVQPFQLQDVTKPGSRKILVFFLVDPEVPILSTTNVPPQQKDWAEPEGVLLEAANKLPTEVFEMIDDLIDFPLSLKVAKEHRVKLMKERKYFVKRSNRETFERPFSLCEH